MMAMEFGASIKVVLDTSKARADLSAIETRLKGLPSAVAGPSTTAHREIEKEEHSILQELRETRGLLEKLRHPIASAIPTAKGFLASRFPKTAMAVGAAGLVFETAEFLGTAIGKASGEAIRSAGDVMAQMPSFGPSAIIGNAINDAIRVSTFWMAGLVEQKTKELSDKISDVRTWVTSLFSALGQGKELLETGLLLGQGFASVLGTMDAFSPLWTVSKARARLEAQQAKFMPEGYVNALTEAIKTATMWK